MVRSIFSDATVVQSGTSVGRSSQEPSRKHDTDRLNVPVLRLEFLPGRSPLGVADMHNANISGTLFADVSGGVTTNPANMDGLEMDGATYSTSSGKYKPTTYKDYYGNPVMIYVNYGPTVLGTTTSSLPVRTDRVDLAVCRLCPGWPLRRHCQTQ